VVSRFGSPRGFAQGEQLIMGYQTGYVFFVSVTSQTGKAGRDGDLDSQVNSWLKENPEVEILSQAFCSLLDADAGDQETDIKVSDRLSVFYRLKV